MAKTWQKDYRSIGRQFFRIIREKFKLEFTSGAERDRILKEWYMPFLDEEFSTAPDQVYPQLPPPSPMDVRDDEKPFTAEEEKAIVRLNQEQSLVKDKYGDRFPALPISSKPEVSYIEGEFRERPSSHSSVLIPVLVGALLMLVVMTGLAVWQRWGPFAPATQPPPTGQLTVALTTTSVSMATAFPSVTSMPSGTPLPLPSDTPIPPSPTSVPTATPMPLTPTSTIPPPTPTTGPSIAKDFPSGSCVQISSNNALAKPWQYAQGVSKDSSVRLENDPCAITVISGDGTDLTSNTYETAPTVGLAINGDFQVQAKLTFNPATDRQLAGLVVRDGADPGNFIGLIRQERSDFQEVALVHLKENHSQWLNTLRYSKPSIVMRITKRKDQMWLAFSEDGVNWFTPIAAYRVTYRQQPTIQLVSYGTDVNGTVATFSDVRIQVPIEDVPTGVPPFTGPDGSLDPRWGWYPGGSAANSKKVSLEGKLTIIAAPKSDLNTLSMPFVALPVSGNFEATIKVECDPQGYYHGAGFLLGPINDLTSWIGLRRSSTNHTQLIEAIEAHGTSWKERGSMPVTATSLYLRIRRVDALVSLEMSSDGISYVPVATDIVISLPEQLALMLPVESYDDDGMSATFSGFTLVNK